MVVAGLVGCGGSDGPPLGGARPSATKCAAGWTPITAAAPGDNLSPLAYDGGQLVYSSLLGQQLLSVPVAGGASTPLAPGYSSLLWSDGDQIVYAGGDDGLQFFGVPIAGGTPTLLFDAAAGRPSAGILIAADLSPTDLAWLETPSVAAPTDPVTLWHLSRADGVATMLDSFPATDAANQNLVTEPPRSVALGDGVVIVSNTVGIAAAVPFDGSAPRALAGIGDATVGPPELIGSDARGIYRAVPRQGVPIDLAQWTIFLSPADGSGMIDVGIGLPRDTVPTGLYSTGDGGWVYVAAETLDDNQIHSVVGFIDAAGGVRTAACDPVGGPSRPQSTYRPAIAPDAVYFIASTTGASSSWQIVRVAR